MNSELDQWLASCTRAPDALGCGVRLTDQTSVSRSFNDAFPQTHLVEALRCLNEFSPVISGHGFFPRWLTWTFEQGQMRVVVRPDGALLALAVSPGKAAAEMLDVLTEEFSALKLTD
jgi:hypothetical protein